MSASARIVSALLPLAALAVAAAPAAAAPAVTPAKRSMTAAPGARVNVRVAVRDVPSCAVTVANRRKSVPAAGRGGVTFSFRLGRRARAGVHRVRVTCPPAAPRTVRLAVRHTPANRRAAGSLLAGPIRATAEAAANAFAMRHGAGTLTTLDADAWVGHTLGRASELRGARGTARRGRATGVTYRWTVDGVRGPSGAVARIRPTVGVHRVRLDITDPAGHTTHVEHNVAVAWRGAPFTAQNDVADGNPGDGLGLPKLVPSMSAGGPWRTVDCLNNGYAYRPYGNTVALTVHQGDHPGTTGGDRCALGINEAITPYVDPNGNTDKRPRFYHVEFMLDPSTAADLHDVFNNLMEWHGKAGGGSVLKFALNARGTRWGVYYTKKLQGASQPAVVIGDRPVQRGVWQDLTVEARWSADPQVGYIRVFWGGVCVTCGMPEADAQGRIFGETLKQLADGSFEKMAFAVQNYRQKDDRQVTGAPKGTLEPLPNTTVWYRNVGIGPTLASAAGGS